MTDKPLLLLDIDGVLNILQYVEPDQGFRHATAMGYRLILNVQHPEWVRDLESDFEIIWSTMWQKDAHVFAAIAGFGQDWSWIDFDTHYQIATTQRVGFGVGSYKHPGIVQTVSDRPAVIIDDDLESWQHDWARNRTLEGFPTLTVQPEAHIGLTSDHVRDVRDFATVVA